MNTSQKICLVFSMLSAFSFGRYIARPIEEINGLTMWIYLAAIVLGNVGAFA